MPGALPMKRSRFRFISAGVLAFSLTLLGRLFIAAPAAADGGDWAASVNFPPSEKPLRLFNGKDFEGWEGNTGENGTPKYFSIKDGAIVARNEADNAPP